ncbi:hypothetical protein B566_EDAN010527 [Ephemera danica]|nr:hypothetical protein B566_EDAN010527 [Ephemera danica]
MVDAQRARVEESMSKLVNDIDKTNLRKLQGEMHRCAAKCCDDSQSSLESVHRCVENCSIPLQQAQKYVQSEIERLQDRLQRCVMQCNDEIRDKIGPNPTESEVSKYTKEFEGCAVKCVDKHIEILPNFFANMKKTLAKGNFNLEN